MFSLCTQRPRVIRAQGHASCPMDLGLMFMRCQRLANHMRVQAAMQFILCLVNFFVLHQESSLVVHSTTWQQLVVGNP